MNQKALESKQAIVDVFSENLKKSNAIFFSEYRGLSAFQLGDLRQQIKKLNGEYKVVKNSLVKRVIDSKKVGIPDVILKGPTGVVFAYDDSAQIAKKLCAIRKENESLVLKGGMIGEQFISEKDLVALSKLPSKDVLIGQFIGGLKNNLTRLVAALNSPVNGLVYTLEAIKNKKQ